MSPLIVCVVNSHGSDVFRSCSASGHTHAPKLPGSARDINCSRLDKHNSICSGIPGQTRSLGRSTRWWLPVRTAAAEEMRLIARHFLPGLEPVAEFTPRSHAIFRLCVVLQSQEIWMLILFLRRGRPSRSKPPLFSAWSLPDRTKTCLDRATQFPLPLAAEILPKKRGRENIKVGGNGVCNLRYWRSGRNGPRPVGGKWGAKHNSIMAKGYEKVVHLLLRVASLSSGAFCLAKVDLHDLRCCRGVLLQLPNQYTFNTQTLG